jgi:predicted HD phosphohydrolase
MKELGGSVHQCVGALLHDIGHFIDEPIDPSTNVNDYHELRGAKWLMIKRFSPAVWIPIMLHVDAKRYLCAVKPYPLSKGSSLSLRLQGGPMTLQEQKEFERNSYFKEALMLRHCDDFGKKIHGEMNGSMTLDSLQEEVESCIE